MKRAIQHLLRSVHRRVLMRPLPDRIAIYFHAVESGDGERFRECLSHWRDLGYHFVGAAELCQAGPGKRIFVSFDDCFRSWVDLLPSFDEVGGRATFFVNTLPLRDRATEQQLEAYFDRIAHRGERETLSTQEVRALADAGHTIGCHGHSHRRMSELRGGELATEIDASATLLAELTGRPVEDLAHPFGMRRHFGRRLRRYCAERGFRTLSDGIPGMQHARPHPHALHRTPWRLERSLEENLDDLSIDGRIFTTVTGRSPIG